MNRLSQILPPSQVLVSVEATSKKRAFEEAGLLFENLHGLNRALITDSLFARERLGSTGLGHGVAIPHGRIKGLKAPMAAVFQLQAPIGFDAPEQQFAVGYRKERAHFSEYRVDDCLRRRIDRTADGLRRPLIRVDFDDLAADEHQVARPV